MSNDPAGPLNLIEIAKLAGVSKSTVSRVVTNHPRVSAETRARVQHIIKVHHYRPSLFGRGLSGARTGLIGVLGRWMESGFTAEVIRGIDDEVKQRGGHLLCTFAPGINEYIDLWRSFVSAGQVDGVILIAPPLDLYAEPLYARMRPIVLCASRPSAPGPWSNIASVTLDNSRSMAHLVEHLIAQGCRRLVHLAGMPDIHDSRERTRVFSETVGRHPDAAGSVIQGAWTALLARSVVTEYLSAHRARPDAFVAFNDPVALGTLQALKALDLRVPQDVAVTGWDDIPFAEYAGLTTIHSPMVEIGWEAARLLYSQIDEESLVNKPRHAVLDTPLRVRETSSRLAAPQAPTRRPRPKK